MIAVIGGGFNGIYAAWRLAREGADVVIFEAATRLGGGMQSLDFRGFRVDVGAQALDFRVKEHEAFFRDIMGDGVRVLENFSAGSSASGSITSGIEYPDFSGEREFCATGLSRLCEKLSGSVASRAVELAAYPELMRERYGDPIGERIIAIAEKLAGGAVDHLGPDATLAYPMLSRVKLGDDAAMVQLKLSDSRLDDRLAVTRECGVSQFLGNMSPRFGYPTHGGLSSLWTAATRRLAELGVRIELGSGIARIVADDRGATLELADGRVEAFAAVAWTLPEKPLAFAVGVNELFDSAPAPTEVGIYLYIFEVLASEVLGPDYVNDFNLSHRVSRCSSGGLCSNQLRNDGTTFVTAEVNCRRGSNDQALSGESQKVWEDLVSIRYLRREAEPLHAAVHRFPRAFVLWPAGWDQEALKVSLDEAIGPRVISCRSAVRGRATFMKQFDEHYLPMLRVL